MTDRYAVAEGVILGAVWADVCLAGALYVGLLPPASAASVLVCLVAPWIAVPVALAWAVLASERRVPWREEDE